MYRSFPIVTLACAGVLLLPATRAAAHAVCGSRIFPVTLTLDDPGVSDEVTLPQIVYQRAGADGGPGPTHDTSVQLEFDKRITEDTALIFNDDWNLDQTDHAKTETGWDDLTVTAKYAKCLNEDHEFIFGFGVMREFGRTGTSHIGSDEYGNTAPTIYFGNGLGDLPVQALRPLAVTGEFSYAIPDKAADSTELDGGLSLQYSLPYLQSQVKDYGLPRFIGNLVPVCEITWSTVTSRGGGPTPWTVAPGAIYLGHSFQVGLEALIPANKAAGTNVGVTLQLHLFLDDLMPRTLGAPLFHF